MPFIYGNIFQNRVNHHRNAVVAVVGCHKCPAACFYSHVEGNRIIFSEQTLIEIRRTTVPSVFIAICEEVFHKSGRHPVFLITSLQSFYISLHHASIEKGIFSITFFRSSPSGITPQICIGRANYQSAGVVFFRLKNISRFVGFFCCYFPDQSCIPRFRQSIRLRKHCSGNQFPSSPSAWSA